MCADLYSQRNFNVNFVFKDGKIEAEDFTSRLYRELNSSPQPYLVPFLKVIRSLLRTPSVGWGWGGLLWGGVDLHGCHRCICSFQAPDTDC